SLQIPHFFVLVSIVLFALSYWTRSQPARHLIILSLIFYVATLAIDHDMVGVAAVLAAISAGIFAVVSFAPEPVDKIVQLDGRLPLHALIGFLTGMALIQFERFEGGGF